MKNNIKVAIVGAGHISEKFHIPSWVKNKNVKITSICDTNKKQLNKISKKFNIKKKYLNLKDLLANEKKIDILNICTPPYLHYHQIKLALKKNINIFVEKPFVVSKSELGHVQKLAKNKKVTVSCTLHQRFRPVSISVKDVLKKKLIGKVYYINIIKRQFRGIPTHSKVYSSKKLSGGGPLIDLGTHYFDLVFWLLNFPKIKKISNMNFNNLTNIKSNKKYLPFKKYDSEELSIGEIVSKDNTLVRYELGYALNQKENITKIEMFGTKGSIQWPSGKLTLTQKNKNIFKKLKTNGLKASIGQKKDFIKNYKFKNKASVKMSQIKYIVNLINDLYKLKN
jgi:predicted dehydrogenase